MMGRGAPLALVAVVLLAAALWAALTDARQTTAGWQSARPSLMARTEVGAARIDGKIYVVGGYRAPDGAVTGAVESYDMSSNTWRQLEPLPIAVNHAGVTSTRDKLYVHGGFRADGGATDRLYRYDPERERWTRLADAPLARGALALQGFGGKLYAAGGSVGSHRELRRLLIYDLSEDDWIRGPNMEVGRNHVASAELDGRIYVIGGRPGPVAGNLRVVERYNPYRETWRRVARLPTATSGAAAAVVREKIVVFGGERLDGSGETIDATQAYNPESNRWRRLPDMLTARHGLGGASRKGRVFAIEGGPMAGLHFSRANEYLEVPRPGSVAGDWISRSRRPGAP